MLTRVYDPYNFFGDNPFKPTGPSITSISEIPGWKPSIVPPSIAPSPLAPGSILSPSIAPSPLRPVSMQPATPIMTSDFIQIALLGILG